MVKKSKTKKIILFLLICLSLVTIFLIIQNNPYDLLGDAGNNNRYEDNGSFSTSGDGDSAFFLFYIIELVFRVIFFFGPIPGIIIIGIFGAFMYYFTRKNSKKIKEALNQMKDLSEHDLTNESMVAFKNPSEVISLIQEIDPNFSSDKFIGWAREVFVKIQQAWSDRNWKIIRPFETEELFSMHNSQLEEYIRNGKINKIEKINVHSCVLRDFEIDGDKEVITIELQAIMRDYVIDEKTNKVLESDPNKDWHMKYLMTFQRKTGVKTKAGRSNKSTTNCPNCGAPTEITSAGECEYCHSVITTGEHDWVLSDIRSIH